MESHRASRRGTKTSITHRSDNFETERALKETGKGSDYVLQATLSPENCAHPCCNPAQPNDARSDVWLTALQSRKSSSTRNIFDALLQVLRAASLGSLQDYAE